MHRVGGTILFCLLFAGSPLDAVRADDDPLYRRTSDVVYGRKHGLALTMDVFIPTRDANGAAVIRVISNGWHSSSEAINPKNALEYLRRGYVVFAVVHGSQPRFTIPEMINDVNRAVRFIRARAQEYKIDPDRIGISGRSAAGHLALMQATAGTAGNRDAMDPIERMSSRVQAAACFFPQTDFLNYGREGENALGRGLLAPFKAPFDFMRYDKKTSTYIPITDEEQRKEIGRQISPITHVSSDDPPTLIIHGDRDLLVPLQQSQTFIAKLKNVEVPAELIVKKGAGHGWASWPEDQKKLADWFDKHLKRK